MGLLSRQRFICSHLKWLPSQSHWAYYYNYFIINVFRALWLATQLLWVLRSGGLFLPNEPPKLAALHYKNSTDLPLHLWRFCLTSRYLSASLKSLLFRVWFMCMWIKLICIWRLCTGCRFETEARGFSAEMAYHTVVTENSTSKDEQNENKNIKEKQFVVNYRRSKHPHRNWSVNV